MLSIIFHLALTVAILWYQRKMSFTPSPWRLTGLWYLVSVALALIETYAQTGDWLSGMFLQSLVLAIFYVPPVFFALHMARRHHLPLWKSFPIFVVGALASSMLAAIAFAYSPFIQHLSS